MKRLMNFIVLSLLVVWGSVSFAYIDTFVFDTPQDEQRFKKLSTELRCLVCQNQNLADSNAELAMDLRREVYNMIKEGKSDTDIIDFMVARYGDFVLYRPPVKPVTYMLWVGPLILFVIGAVVLVMFVRRRSDDVLEGGELSGEEQSRLKGLLDEQHEQSRRKDGSGGKRKRK
ncbi:MAG TPA: cytochrome c-type biogenesis protein CcmH [Gammaproteobacteria bacterium]|nr:cytochrome c-type biogenesis protein CcmH [Gammaproteobacteria bacterium]